MIEPRGWPDGAGRPRVLVENPDGAELTGHEEILREAGYEVAICRGPTGADGWVRGPHDEPLRCPLIETGRCALVEGADVVVTSCTVGQSEELLAALGAADGTRVVFEAPAPLFDRFAGVRGRARMIAFPVTERHLRTAVAKAALQAE